MRWILVVLLLVAAGCRGGPSQTGIWPRVPHGTSMPAVSRICFPQIEGSLTPLGGQRALLAKHLFKQPVASVDGQLTGLDLEVSGGGEDWSDWAIVHKDWVTSSDWAIVHVANARLPAADTLRRKYEFRQGETVYIAGFVTEGQSGAACDDPTLRPTLIRAEVRKPPFWVTQPPVGVVFARVAGNPNLSGASGGPVVIRSGADWHVVGIYLAQGKSGLWTGQVILPLPEPVFDTPADAFNTTADPMAAEVRSER